MNRHDRGRGADADVQPEEEQTLGESLQGQARLKPWKESGELHREQRRQRVRLALTVLAAVSAAALLAFVLYRAWARRPALPIAGDGPVQSAQPTGDQTPAPEAFDGVRPNLSGDRKADFYTFLIVGRDTAGGGNTDTIMLAAYDVKAQNLALMSIPRDTMVNAPWDVKKINSVYNVFENSQQGTGIQGLKQYVSGLIGYEPDFTVVVEWEAVGEIVEAIGGVWFDVPFEMHYFDPMQDLRIDQAKGYRKLTGADAMQIIRWRKNNDGTPTGTDGSDLARIQVQHSFVAAVLKQCLQLQNVTRIKEIARVFTQYVSTELTAGNLVWFAEQALVGGLSEEDLYTCTMPCVGRSAYSRTAGTGLSYVVPVEGRLIEEINARFNPYEEQVSAANLELMRVNPDGSVSCSSGVVRDARAAQARPAIASAGPEVTGPPEPSEPPEAGPAPEDDPVPPQPGGEAAEPSPDPAGGPGPEPSAQPDGEPEPVPSGGTDPDPAAPSPEEPESPEGEESS